MIIGLGIRSKTVQLYQREVLRDSKETNEIVLGFMGMYHLRKISQGSVMISQDTS